MGRALDLNRRETDLVALLRQEVAEIAETSAQHRIALQTSLPELVGWWDLARLERVFANLLSNAVKYSPQGGDVLVSVSREEDTTGKLAVIAITDQGLGIPAEDLPHIFERFHRGQNVPSGIQGTGIGLTGARQIVEQHGGTIGVTSTEGRGSTFTVRLPLRVDAAAQERL
jgi:signal transduction histidine kinase